MLYPDYLAENYGEETYLAWVNAANPKEAVKLAQEEATKAQENPDTVTDPADFVPLLVIKGHHDDLTSLYTMEDE
jgi:hypothetical protein